MNRDEAAEVARGSGARLAESNRDAVESADIVILALPPEAFSDLAAEVGEALAGKTVIDVANRPTPDAARSDCTSHAEEFQRLVPEAKVVKAFNTVFAARQAEPSLEGKDVDAYVAADDASAKRAVLDLVESMGFRPYDVGDLIVARTLEGMGWLHISLAMKNDWSWQSAWRIAGPKGG
jgi:predicted dinucleotide-binding enzyme